ncbi:MAG TPA: hypothetical protein PLW65_04505 [Pseudomonadota bacterium]|nr:hypothetical protein [Pseudomonadota bacterium]
MTPFSDGWLSALQKIVHSILATSTEIDYRALYGGTVLFAQGEDATIQPDGSIVFKDSSKVTVRPDDSRLGDSLVCTLRRPEGYSTVPAAGAACLIGWDGYDPSERYAVMAADSGAAAQALQLQAVDAMKLESKVVHVAAQASALIESPRVNLGDSSGSTLLKSPVGTALVGFAVALAASTDPAVVGAANGLLLALTGMSLVTIPPATPLSPLLPTNVTSKTRAS